MFRSEFRFIIILLLVSMFGLSSQASSSGGSCRSLLLIQRNPFFTALYLLQQPPGAMEIAGFGSQPVRNPHRPSYRNTFGWNAPEMISHLRPRSGAEAEVTSVNIKEFYDAVYGQYQRYDGDLNKLSHGLEQTLEIDRVTYYQIFSKDGIEGTFRLFSAHANRSEFHNDVFVDMPFERLNKARGVPALQISKTLREHAQNGAGVIEIGKFWVRHESTPDVRERASQLLELYWASYANGHPNDIFTAHVLAKSQIRLYRKYGFELVEEYTVPGSDSPEYILTVTGRDFAAALEKLLHVDLGRL